MRKGLIKLPENRVRRNYRGGAGIDRMHGKTVCRDNDMPEEWVGSMVEAFNPGMEPMAHEGLALVETEEGRRFLRDLVDENREYYLGTGIHQDGSCQLSFLLKILDSSMRLHVQAHPSTEFAREVMGKAYGKLECYYILNVREDIHPYIRLGFQHTPGRAGWREIIETQDKERMDACFEKIPVQVGEVWYIPGGMPHAIGEGITMLEIMEPSDLVVRCEFEREGIVVPEAGRFMSQDLEFCLDIFDYTEYSREEIKEKCRIQPQVMEKSGTCSRMCLVNETLTSCFFVEKFNIIGPTEIQHNHKFTLGVICAGACVAEQGDETVSLREGDSFVIAAGVGKYRIIPASDTELVIVYPGREMES